MNLHPAKELRIEPGPALLAGDLHDASLIGHRQRLGELPQLTLESLQSSLERAGIRGRGGAGFPFARKLASMGKSRRKAVVVVNLAEGEPVSAKDKALAMCRPHLILDGARVCAQALGTREVQVIVPGERPDVAEAMIDAMGERPDHFVVHRTSGGFVGGQASAVLELMAGRANLPVTSTRPPTIAGHRGRPTLLSNAETFAQIGWLALRGVDSFCSLGTDAEPGTTLVTLAGPRTTVVHEVAFGELLPLPDDWGLDRHLLVGGFHGTWVKASALATMPLSVPGFADQGIGLGAACVIATEQCPVVYTAAVVRYLADASARRCGPCRWGLPALADALAGLAEGAVGQAGAPAGLQAGLLAGLVDGRGACAHPDGTARLVRSLLSRVGSEVAAHERGHCTHPRVEHRAGAVAGVGR